MKEVPTVRGKTKRICSWPGSDPLMIAYHDSEWGRPIHDDRIHFEFLILEGAQAGLSWSTVLKKRENYRKLFAKFDPKKVAKFDSRKINTLLKDPGIIRNRLKVESAVSGATAFISIQKEYGSFDRYCWEFVRGRPIVNRIKSMKDIRANSPESDALSKDLKKRGFNFVGSTIIYAYMQAVGMVNDHEINCFCYKELTGR